MTTFYTRMESPLGPLLLTSDGLALTMMAMHDQKHSAAPQAHWVQDEAPFAEACSQLEDYFSGRLRQFDLPLAPAGTPFQRRVWDALLDIPYGETQSYADIARRIGSPKACRAVGLANGQNPIAIIIPCHRVIGANGKLTGYGGGLPRKQFLLELEQPSTQLSLV
jgi:methylated-DNA-[protein]-cysteine S-methyltransferase